MAVVPRAEWALCKLVADPFAARSCAAEVRSAVAILAASAAEEPQRPAASVLLEV
jgi:hypothetical protein